ERGNGRAPTTRSGNPGQTKTTGCYLYTLTGTDNVGNTVSISTTVKVDTSDPTISLTPSNATGNAYYPGSGTRVYMKSDAASGGFDRDTAVEGTDTGIASTTVPTGPAMGSGWAGSGCGTSRTHSYTRTRPSAPGAPQRTKH